MKVVAVDNYAREDVADLLIAESVSNDEAHRLAKEYNDKQGPHPYRWAIITEDDYRLSRGMEDLV